MDDGVLLIDKPFGWTSSKVVRLVKRLYPHRKIGHVGTLDPLAVGLLPICIGEATKLADYLLAQEKEYKVTMLLGWRSASFDLEGELVEGGNIDDIDEAKINTVLENMRGTIEQQAPIYSAIKLAGVPLYKLARRGLEVAAPRRSVHIYDIRLEAYRPPRVDFWVRCSKGTYLRSLCAAVGEELGCGAVVEALCRVRSGNFRIEEAIALTSGDVEAARAATMGKIIMLSELLTQMKYFIVGEAEKAKIRNGCQPTRDVIGATATVRVAAACGEMVGIVDAEGKPVAIGKMLHNSQEFPLLSAAIPLIKLLRVFNET